MKAKEIYLVDLNPTIGSGIQKARPCVIVSSNEIRVLPLKIVVPLIGFKESHDKLWMVKIYPNEHNGLSKESTADTIHIRSVSHSRFIKKIGIMDDFNFKLLQDAIKISLDI